MTSSNLVTSFKGVIESYRSPYTGLLSMFQSRPENIVDATQIEIHKQGRYRYASKALLRNASPTNNDADTYRSVTYTPPKYHETMPFVLKDFDRAQVGQTEYDKADRQAQIIAKVARDIVTLEDKVKRAMQIQAAEVFHLGKILFRTNSLGLGVDDVDYDAPSANFATLSNTGDELYFNNAASDAFALLEAHCKKINSNSKGVFYVDKLIWGDAAYSAAIGNAKFQNAFDKNKLPIGELDMREAEADGMAIWAKMNLYGRIVKFYRFTEQYINPADNSTVKDYVNSKSILFIASAGSYQIHYAGIDVIEQIQNPSLVPFMPANGNIKTIGSRTASNIYIHTAEDKNNSTVNLHLRTFPLLVPETSDSFGRLTVLS